MTLIPAFSRKQLVISGILGAVLLVGLNACDRPNIVDLPEGPQTMTGVLQPVAISIVRRGSHILLQNGEGVYYVESTSADLRDYEGMEAVLTGKLELNTDPEDLPVLVVSGATLIEDSLRSWPVPTLKLSVEVPDSWQNHVFKNGIRFTATGSSDVLLSLETASASTLPTGTSYSVNGRRAVRITGTGSDAVYVQNGTQIIVITFNALDNSVTAQRLFNRILRTIKFTATPVNSGTGAATGVPCGGPAGVLCPSGQYCEVTDNVTDIGRCRALKQ